MKKSILFLCTGNSCRSQMAEGFAKKYFSDKYSIYSAGIQKHGMNPRAVKVMNERGVDLSTHSSKTLDDIGSILFDYVFTVCGHANENCPLFLGGKAKIIHVGFDDPPKLAFGLTNEEEILSHYRRVRDEIELFTKELQKYLE
ncbi:MAG: arsenate reductase ArsC [Bacteriovorax sp.]|jgi:arsenate reductase|nr:arsenate reductase ArsC [Bacteriovorax sp.]